MSRESLGLDAALADYVAAHQPREHPLLERLRRETAAMPEANMQLSREQGALLAWLIRLGGARRVLEIGTFTGYSSLAMALALPADGHLITLDKSPEFTATARRYWDLADVAERIELRLGPALDSLADLAAAGARFDLALLDADKEHYPDYVDRLLDLLEPGGVLAVDNVLWSGKVADPAADDEATAAIRAANDALAADVRAEAVLLPVGDGMTLARRL